MELPGTVRDVAKSMEVVGSVTTLSAPTAHTHPAQLSQCRKQRNCVCLTECTILLPKMVIFMADDDDSQIGRAGTLCKKD